MATTEMSFRVTLHEEEVIRGFCKIMDYTVSQLVEMAAVETVHRLGIFDPADLVGKTLVWNDAPLREKGDSVRPKLRVSFTPPNLELVAATVKALGTSLPRLLCGATLRYIATKKKQAGRASPALQEIELPAQYE